MVVLRGQSLHLHHQHYTHGHELAHHAGSSETLLLSLHLGGQAVSPALRCVTALTVFFFLAYLAVVLVRFARTIAARASSRGTGVRRSTVTSSHLVATLVSCEAALTQANDALAHAPMLCILFVTARLRAMELNPAVGDPPRWLQLCMYVGAGALFLRFLFDLAAGLAGPTSSITNRRVTFVARTLASMAIYCVVAAIIVGIFIMRAPPGQTTPDLRTTLLCVAVLTGCYFAEYLVLEVASSAFGAQTVNRARERQLKSGFESVPLQFPSMLCVLLVGMSMRMVQMNLELPHWAYYAVVLSTFAVVSQAAIAFGDVMFNTAWPEDGSKPAQQAGSSSGTPPAPAPRSSTEEGSGWQSQVSLVCQGLLLTCLCVGASLTLVSCFSMEKGALTAVWWPEAAEAYEEDHVPPLSTTMRCVMALTLTYFVVKIPLLALSMLVRSWRKWAGNMLAGVQNALVFAPMLCVMMIGVRLRAMQLKIRDPQLWAQRAMACATGAVIVKVVCSLLREASSASSREKHEKGGVDDPDCAAGVGSVEPCVVEQTVAMKILTIAILAFHYVASVLLYSAVAVLICALLVMKAPVPAAVF